MPSPNQSAAASLDVEFRRKQNQNTADLLSYVQSRETGKTFLIRLILAAIRSQNDIALALASSEMAATLLSGDFRRSLPAILRSIPADEINACLKYSTLWRHVKTLKLTTICMCSGKTID
ncbi:unnamed protein product [Onchocerca ochengi]|uniref:ATP-dependent DNA helicase n=1 Tax=Onchocerca ochengi TaxID=42157 RepID=A0A182E752_ONCOC|nr:unnamed protein product [Onchocerca ochengi]